MKARAAMLFGALAVVLLACESADDGWSVLASQEGKFSVLMPGVPSKVEDVQESEFGALSFTQHLLARPDGFQYGVMYSDMPSELLASFSTDEMLAAVADRISLRFGAETLDERRISENGIPGIEVTFSTQDGSQFIKMRAFVNGRRQYQVLAIAPWENRSSSDIEKFFDSFEITD